MSSVQGGKWDPVSCFWSKVVFIRSLGDPIAPGPGASFALPEFRLSAQPSIVLYEERGQLRVDLDHGSRDFAPDNDVVCAGNYVGCSIFVEDECQKMGVLFT